MVHTLLVLAAGLAGVWAQSPANDTSALAFLSRAFDKCSSDADAFSCLKVKAVHLLDRALAMDSLQVADFATVITDPKASSSANPSPQNLEASLPRDLGEKNSALDQLIQDRLGRLMETKTIQLTVPKDVFEGRHKVYKKGGKGGGVLLVFGAFAAMLLQLAFGKIAVIAGKALLVGKVALLLASIIGIKSLLSQQGQKHHPPQVIYAEPEHHGGWGRSLGVENTQGAQELAYRRHRRVLKL